MPTISTHAPGTFCWFELHTTDDQAAHDFYGAVLGWSERQVPVGPGQVYRIQQLQGQDAAAIFKLMPDVAQKGVPPNWLNYVAVEDVDASTQQAVRLGATVAMAPMDVMDQGRMAALLDPQGASFALWQARKTPGVGILGDPGAQCWSELMTRDTDAALRFYSQLFRWTPEAMAMGPMTYTVFKEGSVPRAGLMGITPEMGPIPSHWLVYFAVTDCDAAIARAQSLGGRLLSPAMTVPTVGRFAPLMDPQGAAFAVMGPEK